MYPIEADVQLRSLAKRAYSVEFDIDDNQAAIERLADMPNDSVAKYILLQGLYERQNKIKYGCTAPNEQCPFR